jgi:hypothetical protein
MALPAVGCSVLGNVKVSDFTFALDVASTIIIDEDDITVEPLVLGPLEFGLRFDYGGFTVTGADLLRFTITYAWDPADIRSLDDVLTVATPVFPGEARVDTEVCPGSPFPCLSPVLTLSVFHNGVAMDLFESVTISPPQTILGVSNVFSVAANGASADFESFENRIHLIPEPAATPAVMGALLLLALRRWRHRS